jgi:hypothetical protein
MSQEQGEMVLVFVVFSDFSGKHVFRKREKNMYVQIFLCSRLQMKKVCHFVFGKNASSISILGKMRLRFQFWEKCVFDFNFGKNASSISILGKMRLRFQFWEKCVFDFFAIK